MKATRATSPEASARFNIFAPEDSIRKRARQPGAAATAPPPAITLRLVGTQPSVESCDETALPEAFEARLVRVLSESAHHGETIDAAFRRKEQQVGAMFATLGVTQSRALFTRLEHPEEGDQLAVHFHRLVLARRQRLLDFLSDSRRRGVIADGAR